MLLTVCDVTFVVGMSC